MADDNSFVEDLSPGAFADSLASKPGIAADWQPLGRIGDGSVFVWLDELGVGFIAPDPRASSD